MPSVTFQPLNLRVECAAGESVFAVARRSGVPIATACGGRASCGLCRVRIVAGEEHLTPQNAAERKHLGNVYFVNRVRLSCQATVQAGDVVVEVPPVAGAARRRA